MVITHNDVNKDIQMLMSSVDDGDRALPSPSQALKCSFFFPLTCLSFYVLVFIVNFLFVSDGSDPDFITLSLGALGAAFVFSLFIGFIIYPQALAYFTLQEDVRGRSLILSRLSSLIRKVAFYLIALNFLLALSSIVFPYALMGAPVLIMLSFFVLNGVIGSEIARYGMGAVLEKMNSLVKKI